MAVREYKEYPKCRKEAYREEYFGIGLDDPYRWLKNGKDPDVLAWVKAENEYTDNWFDREELDRKEKELKARQLRPMYQTISSWGDRIAATVMEDGGYRIVSTDRSFQDERLIVKRGDIPGFSPLKIEACPANPNYILISGVFDGAARMAALVVDCKKKEILVKIEDTFSAIWSPLKEIVYYAATETDVKAQTTVTKVFTYHVEEAETRTVHEESENTIIGEIYASSDGKHIIFNMWQDYSRYRYYSYLEEEGLVTAVNKEALMMNYLDSIEGTHYFISMEQDGRGEVLAVKDGQDISSAFVFSTQKGKGKTIEGGFALDGRLYLLYMNNVCSELVFADGGGETMVGLPSDMGTAVLAGRTSDAVYLKFESFLDKPMLLELKGGEVTPVLVNSGKTYPETVTEQKSAPSVGDGKEIPYFIVHRKDMAADGTNPVWIYAYGGYNASMRPEAKEPVNELDIAEWVDKGGIYVLASIRGGNEFGITWYEEGMKMKKKELL